MADGSRRREAVDDAGRAPDTSEDIPEEPAPRELPDDGIGWYIWLFTSMLDVPAALLGGLFVAVAHGLVLGLIAAFLGLVMGQVVSVALALGINGGSTTDPVMPALPDLPADQRVGSGLMMRRKEKRADVAREEAGILIIILSAPVATLLIALLVGSTVGD